VLYRDRLVGRIDCKAHRSTRRLEVRSIHVEKSVKNDFPQLMAAALQSFASFNGCEQVDIADGGHPDLARLLRAPLTA
jgi:uncharacterized protein YcaQ